MVVYAYGKLGDDVQVTPSSIDVISALWAPPATNTPLELAAITVAVLGAVNEDHVSAFADRCHVVPALLTATRFAFPLTTRTHVPLVDERVGQVVKFEPSLVLIRPDLHMTNKLVTAS